MAHIISQQGDSIDLICQRHYGNTDMVEKVLEANPRLSGLLILDTGTKVQLPIATAQVNKKITNLWD